MSKTSAHNPADFKETLPPSCPPKDAVKGAYEKAFRLVPANPATEEDFKSHAAKGKNPPPDADLCRWASCSLFTVKPTAATLLPRLRAKYSFVAILKLVSGCGYMKEENGHIDFWMFKSFDPVAAILAIEKLDA